MQPDAVYLEQFLTQRQRLNFSEYQNMNSIEYMLTLFSMITIKHIAMYNLSMRDN